MIQPFYGEFLVQPFPLDLALNYCSHKCAYCFANLNKPGRKADLPAIVRQVERMHDHENLTARLLREGYPVVMSNKVDPFASSNYQLTLPLLKLFKAKGIPVAFQTKGGKGIDEALKTVSPSYWYVSIAFQDDAIRRKIEPGAPSIQSRWELVRQLRDAGHAVCIGANPLVPEWIPDIPAFLDDIEKSGAQGVWAETLHLNNNQTRNMLPREIENMGADIVKRAYKGGKSSKEQDHLWEFEAQCVSRGIPTFGVCNPTPSRFWQPAQEIYEKTFPIMQDAINWASWKSNGEGLQMTFRMFRDSLYGSLPDGDAKVMDYLGATAPKLKADIPQAKGMTYEKLLQLIWQDVRMAQCPENNMGFIKSTGLTQDGLPVYWWGLHWLSEPIEDQ
jgi:DNA repair photolyase